MSSSQRDMFASQRDMFEESPTSKLSSSLPASISYTYIWVILFDWDENVECPFNLYQIALFSSAELKPLWINGDLDSKSRQKKMTFSPFPGKSFSLFGKVEKCRFSKNIILLI